MTRYAPKRVRSAYGTRCQARTEVGNPSAYGVPSPYGDYGNGTRFVRARLPQVGPCAYALRRLRYGTRLARSITT